MLDQKIMETQQQYFNVPFYQIQAFNSLFQALMANNNCKLEVKEEYGIIKEEEIEKQQFFNFFPPSNKKSDLFFSIYPGETKNYYKNIGQKIANFICETFKGQKEVLNDTHIKYFIRTESQKYSRLTLLKLLKSRKGRKICRLFFANYKWVRPFVAQHKTELDLYFRFNKQHYSREKQMQQIKKKKANMANVKQEEN